MANLTRYMNNPITKKAGWAIGLGIGVVAIGGLVYAFWPTALDRAKAAGLEYRAVVKKWSDAPPTSQAQIEQAQAEIAAAKAKYVAAAKEANVQINV